MVLLGFQARGRNRGGGGCGFYHLGIFWRTGGFMKPTEKARKGGWWWRSKKANKVECPSFSCSAMAASQSLRGDREG